MSPSFRVVSPDRLQIREGGGCMSVFGLPFFAAGVFMSLTVLGIVPMKTSGGSTVFLWPVLAVMAVLFTAVGGVLVFGRSWTIVDRAQREVITQWGLIVPLRERASSLDSCDAIRLGFTEGDSDSADQFQVALKAKAAPDLPLCSFTSYADARECAKALAEHLRVEIEDATTDHPVRLTASQIDLPLQTRLRQGRGLRDEVTRPPNARSQVTPGTGQVTIVIPTRPLHGLLLVLGLLPLAIPVVLGPPLATFFRQTHTPGPVGWAFLAFLTVCFGILPALTVVNGFLRSRRGATIVEVSSRGLHIRERGAWRTRPIASLDAAEILDVDYSSRDSIVASATRATEQQVRQSYPDTPPETSECVERMAARLTRFVTSKGLTVKSRSGLLTIGKGLDDEEVRYLHSVIRNALTRQPS